MLQLLKQHHTMCCRALSEVFVFAQLICAPVTGSAAFTDQGNMATMQNAEGNCTRLFQSTYWTHAQNTGRQCQGEECLGHLTSSNETDVKQNKKKKKKTLKQGCPKWYHKVRLGLLDV